MHLPALDPAGGRKSYASADEYDSFNSFTSMVNTYGKQKKKEAKLESNKPLVRNKPTNHLPIAYESLRIIL